VHPVLAGQWKMEILENAGSLFDGKRGPKLVDATKPAFQFAAAPRAVPVPPSPSDAIARAHWEKILSHGTALIFPLRSCRWQPAPLQPVQLRPAASIATYHQRL